MVFIQPTHPLPGEGAAAPNSCSQEAVPADSSLNDKEAVVHKYNGILLLLSHFSRVRLCATP